MRLFRHAFMATCKCHSAQYPKPLARAYNSRSSDIYPRNVRCGTSKSTEPAARFLQVGRSAGAWGYTVGNEEASGYAHERRHVGEYFPPLHPSPRFPILPSSPNDVRVHRQLLGTHRAPPRYPSECARPEVDTSIACSLHALWIAVSIPAIAPEIRY